MTADRLHILRIFIDADVLEADQPYSKVLFERAKALGIANASALQVAESYGGAGIVHGAKALDLAPEGRVIIELVDQEDRLRAFLDTLGPGEDVGLVTLETIAVVKHGGHHHHSAT
jgi:PII-like signaling protein